MMFLWVLEYQFGKKKKATMFYSSDHQDAESISIPLELFLGHLTLNG